MHTHTHHGFSLIELLIVTAMLVILGLIIYPTYSIYIIKTQRVEAQTALLDLASRMERYHSQYGTYKGATLLVLNAPAVSAHGYYTLDIAASYLGPHAYLLRAIPQAAQVNDVDCGTLTLDETGKKGITGTGKVGHCW